MIGFPTFPIIKPKGFMNALNKTVIDGIPYYADSRRNPKCIGTPEWDRYWSTELEKCINGFEYKSIWIPGRFYFYMNYKQMSTIKGVVTPDMIDLHLELAYYIEYCKANGKNLLCAKGRRKGISEAAATMIVDYGWRFKEGYKAGIAAGNKTYVDDFLAKWRFADSRMPPEFSTKKLVDNDDEIISGYSIRNGHGAYEERGTFNTIYARTMHTNPNMFKGLYLNDVLAEEIGEFEKFLEFFSATKDTLMSGNKQIGTMTGFGTGGNVNKGSRDFQKVWYDAEIYNFEKLLIPSTRMYYYGGAKEPERQLPAESSLFKIHKPFELIGYEDRELAKVKILEKRESYLKQGNQKAYNEDLQNNPINEEEIFKKTVVNNFNINILNSQKHAIFSLPQPKWTKYKLDWEKDTKTGLILNPSKVKFTALKSHENPDECIWIIDGEFPNGNFYYRYTAGIDSYDQDTAKASKSLGAMCVIDRTTKMPVAVICCRPKRKETFYELCIKLSVLYKLTGSVLVDIAAGVIINHFEQAGLRHYLADRPRKFESESSEQTHEKGFRLTNFSRPRMVSEMQSHIEDYGTTIWFPELIHQLGNYDEVEVGSDNDLADAYGIALVQDKSFDIRPQDQEEEDDVNNKYTLTQFESDGRGGLRESRGSNSGLRDIQEDHELFGELFGSKE